MGDYGLICKKCTKDKCTEFEHLDCNAGTVFKARDRTCSKCVKEFGKGTLECNDHGAIKCDHFYHIEDRVDKKT